MKHSTIIQHQLGNHQNLPLKKLEVRKRGAVEPCLPVLGIEEEGSQAREWWTASREEKKYRGKEGLPLPEQVTGGVGDDESC